MSATKTWWEQTRNEYNEGYNHGYDYAAYQQKKKEEAWQWWEAERDELNQLLKEDADEAQVIIFEDGYTIHDKIKTKH